MRKAQLERICETGDCSDPTCDHTHGPLEDVFLRMKCHPGVPFYVFHGQNLVAVTCAECFEVREAFEIVWVRTKQGSYFDPDHGHLVQVCHPDGAAFASYKRGTGRITFTCADCQGVIATVKIK